MLKLVSFLCAQWAEVLSADAFSAFEDVGLDNEKVQFFLFSPIQGGALDVSK
jgi:Zn-dependent oligopeptidase